VKARDFWTKVGQVVDVLLLMLILFAIFGIGHYTGYKEGLQVATCIAMPIPQTCEER
jgi:hypothetical protein